MDPLNQMLENIKTDVERKYEGSDYTDSYLIFLDIMGMKELVSESYETLRRVFNVAEIATNIYGNISIGGGDKFLSQDQVKITTMSDSIVISIGSDVDYAFSKLVGISSYIIKNFLTALNFPVFVRGAIVRGEIYQSGATVFGPALTEAYLLESKTAVSMRCILSKPLIKDNSVIEYMETSPAVFQQDAADDFKFINFVTKKNQEVILNYSQSILKSDKPDSVKSKYTWLQSYIKNISELPEA